jgi:integrase
MTTQRITKRSVDAIDPTGSEFTVWDNTISGFGVRVRSSGAKSYVVVYRAGAGRGAPVRRFTIAATGKINCEHARARAKALLGAVAQGSDPASAKTTERSTPTVAELADRFMSDHVLPKRKPSTAELYRGILDRHVTPAFGTTKADKLSRQQVGRLHSSLVETPFHANRMLAVVGSMYAFGERAGIVPEGINPARKIEKFKESHRERFLTGEELERLGKAIREAESVGIAWATDGTSPKTKHLAKPENRFTKINEFAAAALRLLLFTGCRLREILNLRWENVDMERGLLFLPDSKTGRKTVVLNGPALAVLSGLMRIGPYVIPGANPQRPRPDLHRPWHAVINRADLVGVRLHDLRHTYASYGAGDGFGLPIIGRLLGHTQASTTARYAHLDNDPLRHASEVIAGKIEAALGGNPDASLLPFRKSA